MPAMEKTSASAPMENGATTNGENGDILGDVIVTSKPQQTGPEVRDIKTSDSCS